MPPFYSLALALPPATVLRCVQLLAPWREYVPSSVARNRQSLTRGPHWMTCIFDPEALSGLGKDQRLVFITPQTYDG